MQVNFWLTPDEANLGTLEESTGGGLRVYLKSAPAEWSFNDFNHKTKSILKHLGPDVEADAVVVPYLQNRTVIFDSQVHLKVCAVPV